MIDLAQALESVYDEVSYDAFYDAVFPVGAFEQKGVYEQGKYNGIAISIGAEDEHAKRYTVTDDHETIDDMAGSNDFCLMSPISYAGKSRKSENARFLYALAIDLDGVKNIVGAFYQPKKVLIDPDTLKTLDKRQFSAGMAEVIKMALTSNANLFALIRDSKDPEADLEEIIVSALQIKKDVVEQDPKENGLRKILNFGHTIGHAIESLEDGRLLHGECVALGMLPMCEESVRKELLPLLKKFDLPTTYDKDKQQLMPLILHDKKMQKDSLTVIYVPQIGRYEIRNIQPEEMEMLL